jgi:hypothetical protein
MRTADALAGTTILKDSSPRAADRFSVDALPVEEVLVVDDRFSLSPAQVVENRLSGMLRESTLPISHLQTRGILRAR